MQEALITKIQDEAEVSRETAEAAAKAVIGFLKDKLPESISPYVVAAAEGESLGEQVQDAIGDKLGGIGSFFGGGD